jgi:hypothetical protein
MMMMDHHHREPNPCSTVLLQKRVKHYAFYRVQLTSPFTHQSPQLVQILSQLTTQNSYVYTHSFFHGFGAYAPSLHAESVGVNAQPAETPGAWSLSTCPACRSELCNSVETPRAAPKPIQIGLYAPNLQVWRAGQSADNLLVSRAGTTLRRGTPERHAKSESLARTCKRGYSHSTT